MALPPGQRRIDGFPRFGTRLRHPPPAVPAEPVIAVAGAVTTPLTIEVAELAAMEQRRLTADFHCVAGWSATDISWEGVPFAALYRERIEPLVAPGAPITHLVFEGLDSYRSVVTLEDALAGDVLLALRLEGEPLDGDHGAPVRLLSPSQYGFISTKHLCRVELHTSEPRTRYHRSLLIHLGLELVKPHARARVAHEERHRYLPARLLRPVYRSIVPFLRARR